MCADRHRKRAQGQCGRHRGGARGWPRAAAGTGRVLLLAPAAFCSYVPCDPDEEQPTLHYEAAHPDRPGPRGPHTDLAALLGHSRSAVLETIAVGVSTGTLARRAGLSVSSASEHATVLRRAGLVATTRTGRTTHHTLTPLGADLLQHARCQ